MQLLDAFGISWQTLLAQLVNFAILLFLLYKIGYKPILKFVQDRTETIEQGVANAKKAEESLADAKQQSENIINDARKEAQKVIGEAREQATAQGAALLEKQQAEIAAAAEKAKAALSAERDNVLRETKEQAAGLVLAATEKLLREKVDTESDKAYVEKVLSEMN
jgi:F-type H+-transporting ATPase subunit b